MWHVSQGAREHSAHSSVGAGCAVDRVHCSFAPSSPPVVFKSDGVWAGYDPRLDPRGRAVGAPAAEGGG